MNAPRAPSRARALLLALAPLLLLALARPAVASPKEAAKHFSRGVSLYGEADYRAALVEFERAYELAPNPAVLYNIGQTHFQLQSYAAALLTFERYLAEAPAGARHRADVEQAVETLRARVGKLAIATTPPGAEILIDDEVVGTTPLPQPVLVSIGRRRVVAQLPGQPAQARLIDVAAGDTATVQLTFALPTAVVPAERAARDWSRVGWITTAALGAAAVTAGTLAFFSARDLDRERDTFPAEGLSSKSTRTTALSITADAVGAAALLVGGITAYTTLSRRRPRERSLAPPPAARPARAAAPTLRVHVGRGVAIGGTF
jgi:hypothetical protein